MVFNQCAPAYWCATRLPKVCCGDRGERQQLCLQKKHCFELGVKGVAERGLFSCAYCFCVSPLPTAPLAAIEAWRISAQAGTEARVVASMLSMLYREPHCL